MKSKPIELVAVAAAAGLIGSFLEHRYARKTIQTQNDMLSLAGNLIVKTGEAFEELDGRGLMPQDIGDRLKEEAQFVAIALEEM